MTYDCTYTRFGLKVDFRGLWLLYCSRYPLLTLGEKKNNNYVLIILLFAANSLNKARLNSNPH